MQTCLCSPLIFFGGTQRLREEKAVWGSHCMSAQTWLLGAPSFLLSPSLCPLSPLPSPFLPSSLHGNGQMQTF